MKNNNNFDGCRFMRKHVMYRRVIKLFDWNGIKQMARSFHTFFLYFSPLTCGTT